jgi:transaldolase
MEIFIDSADIKEIREANAWGIVDGVTTNPTLIAKSGRNFRTVIDEICSIVDGPISAECNEPNAPEMIVEGRGIAKFHKNIIVKVPLTAEGLKTVKVLHSEGIKTNVTLCFSAAQGLLAAKAGATYISPFLGRLDDIATEGMQLVDDLVTIFSNYDMPTKVLAASIRSPRHVVQAALCGAHAGTMPFKVLAMLVKHPLTDAGMELFNADWKKALQAK